MIIDNDSSLDSMIRAFSAALAEKIERDFTEVKPEALGLDNRAGYRLYVSTDEELVAVKKSHDRTLQYYGGFEYVDADYRKEVGDYVIYEAYDNRVQDCLERFAEYESESEAA